MISNKNGHAVTSVLPDGSAHNSVSPVKQVFADAPQANDPKKKLAYPPAK